MAKTYGTVTTFTSGSVLTAAQLNVASTAVNNLVVPAACRLKLNNAVASFTSGNPISWESIASPGFDTDSMWSAGNASRITFNTAGIYVVTGSVFDSVTVATSTYQTVTIRVNGTTSHASQAKETSVTAGVGTSLSVSMIYNATAGDYVELLYTYTSGTHTIQNNNVTQFGAAWVGRTS